MKLAFVNQRYGLEVNGGSEYYTRLLAEHLCRKYEVEILTAKAKNSSTWENEYTQAEEVINGIHVRRFPVAATRGKKFNLVDSLWRHIPFFKTLFEKTWIRQ